MSFVTHLECSLTGERHDHQRLHNLSRVGKPLLVRYDLDAIGRAVSRDALAQRPRDMWRYRELLPLPAPGAVVSLGEAMTPLVALQGLSREAGGGEVLVKDEGRMPTGSFKARGLSLAVAMARHFRVETIAMPTSGNAGAALASYASRAGLAAVVVCPEDTVEVIKREIAFHGARTYLVEGIIGDCGAVVAKGVEAMGWFDMSTLKEPYRIEGKKTMGLELAEQLGWDVPDVIFYPTGGGTGLIGIWKALAELEALGWIGPKRPRMAVVQSTGCGPLVRAFEAGAAEVAEPWAPVTTNIHGVRVAKPLGDYLCMRVIYESGGFAEAVDDAAAHATRAEIAAEEGLHLSPEGAACVAAYRQALAKGRIAKGERAVLFNTASGLKAPMPPVESRIDRGKPIDFRGL